MAKKPDEKPAPKPETTTSKSIENATLRNGGDTKKDKGQGKNN
jgi:hypothetical protein